MMASEDDRMASEDDMMASDDDGMAGRQDGRTTWQDDRMTPLRRDMTVTSISAREQQDERRDEWKT